jgi:hypothetical protein
MPYLTISDEMFERLSQRAAALNVSVEQLATPLLNLAAQVGGNGDRTPLSTEACLHEWKKHFDAWMAEVQSRAHRYPPAFVMDAN